MRKERVFVCMFGWLGYFGGWLGKRLHSPVQSSTVAEAPGSWSHTGYPVRKQTERWHSARSLLLIQSETPVPQKLLLASRHPGYHKPSCSVKPSWKLLQTSSGRFCADFKFHQANNENSASHTHAFRCVFHKNSVACCTSV